MFGKISLMLPAVLTCASALMCPGCATNPITGKQQFMLISPQQDIEIGRQYAPEVEKQMGGKIPDPALQQYIDTVGRNVARVSHTPDLDYHFVAVNDKSVNAVALPGGYVFITRGMLENLQTEAQLAAILAHETVHIVARHSSEAMSRQIGFEILLSAVMDEQTSQTLQTVAGLSRQLIELGYSRDQEQQADLGGIEYMVRAGYAPYAMVETMQMLQNQHKVRPIVFLSTHPSPENRIAYLEEKIATAYYGSTALRVAREEYQNNVLTCLR